MQLYGPEGVPIKTEEIEAEEEDERLRFTPRAQRGTSSSCPCSRISDPRHSRSIHNLDYLGASSPSSASVYRLCRSRAPGFLAFRFVFDVPHRAAARIVAAAHARSPVSFGKIAKPIQARGRAYRDRRNGELLLRDRSRR